MESTAYWLVIRGIARKFAISLINIWFVNVWLINHKGDDHSHRRRLAIFVQFMLFDFEIIETIA